MVSGTRKRFSRVLVVDDDEPFATSLVQVLEEEGFHVVFETDARQALVRIQSGEEFDVIFCDVQMPRMTGVEFHHALVLAGSTLASRVVFMTGGATTGMLRYLSRPPNICVAKPLDGQALVQLVHERMDAAAGCG